ncbi:hypothetical protein D6D85_07135 [Candidatus Methanodesulfokora washburnensis]|jgi:hypothetical protein|uniref:Uncharacterized protein n=1 Tax=Candidatus Methanodesulfokora washburnensis TaxID=2478471 RepID=A0A429GMA1_9CREN|nr:hypothetical protein D6D85_07135 [Candidatus Methanodesulfokores washburnensis]
MGFLLIVTGSPHFAGDFISLERISLLRAHNKDKGIPEGFSKAFSLRIFCTQLQFRRAEVKPWDELPISLNTSP